jgi:hypothetical protein
MRWSVDAKQESLMPVFGRVLGAGTGPTKSSSGVRARTWRNVGGRRWWWARRGAYIGLAPGIIIPSSGFTVAREVCLFAAFRSEGSFAMTAALLQMRRCGVLRRRNHERSRGDCQRYSDVRYFAFNFHFEIPPCVHGMSASRKKH